MDNEVKQQKGTVKRRTIVLGAMEDKLSSQLTGLNIPKDRLHVLDKLAESLTWCFLHGLITDTEHERAGRKLIAKVQAYVREAAIKSPTKGKDER
jgi:hypothetical protein